MVKQTALAHYTQEFGRLEFVLRNIYQVVPEEEEVSLTSCNADLLEDIGQKWALQILIICFFKIKNIIEYLKNFSYF